MSRAEKAVAEYRAALRAEFARGEKQGEELGDYGGGYPRINLIDPTLGEENHWAYQAGYRSGLAKFEELRARILAGTPCDPGKKKS